MHIRPLKESDVPLLREIYTRVGYPFEFPVEAEESLVAVDYDDKPILGVWAVKTIEMVMVCDSRPHKAVRMQAMGLVDQSMRRTLKARGWKEALAFVGPRFKSYARFMVKRFGWLEEYTAYKIEG